MKIETAVGAIVAALVAGVAIGWLARFGPGEPEVAYTYVYRAPAAGAVAVPASGAPLAPGIAGSPSLGPATAKVTIVESSDFQ